MAKGQTDDVTTYSLLALSKQYPCVILRYLTTLSKVALHSMDWNVDSIR